jgi:hypothetical protein
MLVKTAWDRNSLEHMKSIRHSETTVAKRLRRYALAGVATTMLIAWGCSSCQESPELPLPVPQEGRLPRAPEPPATAGTPYVPPPGCAVVASASVEEGVAPLEVHFMAEGMCTDAEGTFTWNFGDGSEPARQANATHVYEKPGDYTATVTLEDAPNNAKDSDEQQITVTAP